MTAGADHLNALPIPITTPRLRLERPSMGHVAEYCSLLGDRAVSRWLLRVPWPYRPSDAREFILRSRRNRRAGSNLALAIVEQGSEHLVGGIGLHGIEWDHGHAELGYWIGRPYWGRGYATESVQALVAGAFRRLRLHRIEAGVFRGNPRSPNVLRKAGFALEGVAREAFFKNGRWVDDLCYGLTKPDWLRRPVRRSPRVRA